MTAFDRFDQRLANGLDDLAAERYPDYFDDVLELAVRRSQRPAWTFPERWLPMSTVSRRTVFAPVFPWRTAAILLALLAILIVATVIAIGFQPRMTPAPAFGLAANGSITYTRDGDLYVRDAVGGPERLLVGGPEFDVYPFFSRDGTMLAFFRATGVGAAERAAVMVANADGSDVRILVGPSTIYSAAWSPSSTELALVTKLDGGPRSLSIVPIEEGAAIRTLDLPISPSDEVGWRPPDGREIIFRGNHDGLFAIYAIKPDGSGHRQLTDKRNSDYYWGAYAMSPDGSEVAYTNGDGQVTIHILDLDTKAERLWGAAMPRPEPGWTGTTHWGSPVYSADGTKFVFGRYWDEDGTRINHQVWVATVASDGADAVPVGEVHRSVGGSNPFAYGFAPDDTRIVIQDNDVRQTWIADPAGGEPEPLGWGEVLDPPTWQRLPPSGG